MNWTTLYITGRGDFREDVFRKLENGDIDFMPGYLDSSAGRGFFDLYWVDESSNLQDFKKTIGSKLIWKYRLRFYCNLEDFTEALNNSAVSKRFTEEENSLMEAMRKSA
jgi:hypothetical protein